MIVTCICKCPMQDALHGIGRRVANVATKQTNKARCTSCGTLVDFKKDSDSGSSKKTVSAKVRR